MSSSLEHHARNGDYYGELMKISVDFVEVVEYSAAMRGE